MKGKEEIHIVDDDIGLSKYESNLPATLEDLSRFVLVGREKLASVRAEIRAIEKLSLAQQVREQKIEECRRLAEVLLDAETKVGDLLKNLPKGSGKKRINGSVQILLREESDKTKGEVIRELGFNKDQARRFELLAKNKGVVEQLKAEARENNRIPSRAKILRRIQQEKTDKFQQNPEPQKTQVDEEKRRQMKLCVEIYRSFNNALEEMWQLDVGDNKLKVWSECIKSPISIQYEKKRVDQALTKVMKMRDFLNQLEILN